MAHNSSSRVQVTNNFGYAADITLNHTYDNSPAESMTWKNVLPATTTDPDFVVTFNLGPTAWGKDSWQAEIQLLDGPKKGHYISDLAHCTLHSPDNGSTLTMTVSDPLFVATASRNHDGVTWSTRP